MQVMDFHSRSYVAPDMCLAESLSSAILGESDFTSTQDYDSGNWYWSD